MDIHIMVMAAFFGFRRAKGFHAVRDHFHSGHGRTAGDERAEDQKQRQLFDSVWWSARLT